MTSRVSPYEIADMIREICKRMNNNVTEETEHLMLRVLATLIKEKEKIDGHEK